MTFKYLFCLSISFKWNSYTYSYTNLFMLSFFAHQKRFRCPQIAKLRSIHKIWNRYKILMPQMIRILSHPGKIINIIKYYLIKDIQSFVHISKTAILWIPQAYFSEHFATICSPYFFLTNILRWRQNFFQ